MKTFTAAVFFGAIGLSTASPFLNTRDSGIYVADTLIPAEAVERFKTAPITFVDIQPGKRQDSVVIPQYLFVLYCTDGGFQGECEILGAPPGFCANWSSFGSESIVARFDNNASSVSTNTGGMCQFYREPGCGGVDRTDPGVTMNYGYDLANNGTSGYRGIFPLAGNDNNISSWRC